MIRCVAFVTYTMGINGGCSDSFVLSMSLSQGDPLSPFLFLLCVEGLSMILVVAQKENLIRGVCVGRGRVTINHLFFADNSIIFREAIKEQAKNVHRVISEYEKAFGQTINYDKS
ncbi:hypothetical protein PVK06_048714 [Gossypium arboreum]|uniref:Reverse transcriptase domain-containing protein n=1 Tax=Gossypium arboreum TaxID=29729 RepID=A0ABR0MH75_GOSAR|nr:hypothetical protein PVK06_048714 [Gossypium arboreum]